MRTYIKKLQSKPEHIRKQILFGSLIVCMSFVSFVWIGNLGNRFAKKDSNKIEEDIKPFALFGQTMTDTYKNISASVAKVSIPSKEKIKNIKEEKVIDLIPIER